MTVEVNASKPEKVTAWLVDPENPKAGFWLRVGTELVTLSDAEAATLGRFLVFEN